MEDVLILINSNEFQSKILDFINSEELDKFIDTSIYSDNKDARGAIIFGLSLAASQTCRCQQYLVSKKELDKSENVPTEKRGNNMTVKELIDKLKEFPEDMPVAVDFYAHDDIEVNINICESEHGYHEPFEYVNLT